MPWLSVSTNKLLLLVVGHVPKQKGVENSSLFLKKSSFLTVLGVNIFGFLVVVVVVVVVVVIVLVVVSLLLQGF